MINIIFGITDKINNVLSYTCAILAGIALCFYFIKYSSKSIKERGVGQGALLSFILILEYILGAGIVLGLAVWLPTLTKYITQAAVIWVEIYAFVFFYYKTRKQSEGRGLYPVFLNLVALNAGWYADRWLGMLFYSVPLLFIFHHILHHIALVTIPASNPNDKIEIKQRRNIFLSYVLGLQMPLWNVNGLNAQEVEKMVDGAPVFGSTPFPGMIKTNSNQVVGICNNIKFRVEGPGLIFTKKGDQPFEVIDLRVQNRTSTIRAFSKEGIPFFAAINITFKIYDETPDQNSNGLFPYSGARAKSVLYLRSKRAQPDGEIDRWDTHVLAIAEEAAREILVEHTLSELWNLENPNATALDEITQQLKAQIEIPLLAKGVKLISAKASPDFSNKAEFSKKDREVIEKVINQQIVLWSVERKQERITAQTNAKIHAEHVEQEAHVHAYSALLTAIAEGLQVAQTRDTNTVREIILLRYVSALKSLINQQSYISKNEELPKSTTNVLKKIQSRFPSNQQRE